MTEISQKKRIPHTNNSDISPSRLFNEQIGLQPPAMSKKIHKCSGQSLCLGRPLLVHADEGRQSQD